MSIFTRSESNIYVIYHGEKFVQTQFYSKECHFCIKPYSHAIIFGMGKSKKIANATWFGDLPMG